MKSKSRDALDQAVRKLADEGKPLPTAQYLLSILPNITDPELCAAMNESEEYFDCKRCGHRVHIGWAVCPTCNSLVGHKPDQDYSDE